MSYPPRALLAWLLTAASLSAAAGRVIVLGSQEPPAPYRAPGEVDPRVVRHSPDYPQSSSSSTAPGGFVNPAPNDVRKCVRNVLSKLPELSGQKLQIHGKFRLAACRRHHLMRHKSSTTSSGGRQQQSSASNPPEPVLLPPKEQDPCSAVARFLANDTVLRGLQQTMNDRNCSYTQSPVAPPAVLISQATVDDDTFYAEHRHRNRIWRKWRHSACRFYQDYRECVKSVTTETPQQEVTSRTVSSPSDHVTPGPVVKPAVHVADSSHIDFLQFMIGDDKEWSDNYEFWFY